VSHRSADGGGPAAGVTRVAAFIAALVVVAAAAILTAVVATRPRPPEIVHRRVTTGDRTVMRIARTRLGRILVDGRGHTLYLFLNDRHGRSACRAGCARVWAPVVVSGRPRVATGIIRTKMGTTRRADGALQLMYNGHPLYALTVDTRPGQIRGQGFLRSWYAVSPAGHPVGRRGTSRSAGY
jgi:predicted lipoprotein with Yx(FWY)xxD motif